MDKRTISPVSRERIRRAPLTAINELIAELEGKVDNAIKIATDKLKTQQSKEKIQHFTDQQGSAPKTTIVRPLDM